MKPKKSASKTSGKKESQAPAPSENSQASTSKSESPRSRKKAAARSVKPDAPAGVPDILLETDTTPAIGVRGPGQKYVLGPTPVEHLPAMEEGGELPEAYGTKTLLLAARDPHWLYAHWDLTRDQLRKYNSLSRDRHLILRVFVDAVRGEPFAEVHVHPESRNWFVHVGRGGTKFVAELGYYQKDNHWNAISISGATLTPPDKLSDDTSVWFQTIPIEVPFETLLKHVQSAAREHRPLAEAIQELRRTGFADLPEPEAVSRQEWTPAQAEALGQILSMDRMRRVWMGSLEITELLRRQITEELSSAAAAQFSRSEAWSETISSMSSPFGGMERFRSFWFNVNAELIVYGATEPDAEVRIGGRKISLRPDGSFSYRFALPDGNYELPAIAVSADREDARSARLEFSRNTEYRGEVQAHPQDEALKTPHPANVS